MKEVGQVLSDSEEILLNIMVHVALSPALSQLLSLAVCNRKKLGRPGNEATFRHSCTCSECKMVSTLKAFVNYN